jgi:hypothetical protein
MTGELLNVTKASTDLTDFPGSARQKRPSAAMT